MKCLLIVLAQRELGTYLTKYLCSSLIVIGLISFYSANTFGADLPITDPNMRYSAWVASHKFIKSEMPDSEFICWSSLSPYSDYSGGGNPPGRAGFGLWLLDNGQYLARGYALRNTSADGFHSYACEMTYSNGWNLVNVQVIQAGTYIGGNRDICDCNPDRGFVSDTSKSILVPGWYTSIQAAIDCATNGDTVLVADGIFTGTGNREIAFHNKLITVKSEHGPLYTILDCQNLGRGFHISDNEDSTSAIIGFTIRNGRGGEGGGGGISMVGGAWPMIVDCIIDSCSATKGGAIYITGADRQWIRNCIFRNNNAVEGGGGVFYENNGHDTHLADCLFEGNSASNGGAVMAWDNTIVVIDNCTFVHNQGTRGSVSYQYALENITFTRCILSFNLGAPIWCESSGTRLFCSDIFGNVGGDWSSCVADQQNENNNFSLDPLFCDSASGTFKILATSPCAPANNVCGRLIGASDIGCAFTILGEALNHVKSHNPVFSWAYLLQPNGFDSSEIDVGTDTDWGSVEMWNPQVSAGTDSAAIYAGATLQDGVTYFARLRVCSELGWSNWLAIAFRMNTPPSIPQLMRPINNAVLSTATPAFYWHNSSDPEMDSIRYYYEVLDHNGYGIMVGLHLGEQSDSTGFVPEVPLAENEAYSWFARAYDGYEQSAWSDTEHFYINAIEEFPAAFLVYFPPDTDNAQIYDFPVEFWWGAALDPDPCDSAHYKLMIAIDSNFNFVSATDSIFQTHHPVSNLNYSTHYWWKVMAVDTKGNATTSTNVADFWTWVLGDVNHDRKTNVGDAVFMINYIFKLGYPPSPLKTGDVNADCRSNVGDVVYLINYVFKGGPPPKAGCAAK
jgi:hypothetical protein